MHRLSDAREELQSSGIKVVLNTAALVSLSRDKWDMFVAVAAMDADLAIPTFVAGNFTTFATSLGLPFLLKPRRSYASKGIVVVDREETFEFHAPRIGAELIVQPRIGHDDQEYTVSVFGEGAGGIAASIALRRRLASDGSTAKAWVVYEPTLNDAVARLVRLFAPIGPTNLQFRRDGKTWRLLEINPRISSATSIRTAFGYNEAAMSHDYYLLGRMPTQPPLRRGFATRYIEDVIIYDRDYF